MSHAVGSCSPNPYAYPLTCTSGTAAASATALAAIGAAAGTLALLAAYGVPLGPFNALGNTLAQMGLAGSWGLACASGILLLFATAWWASRDYFAGKELSPPPRAADEEAASASPPREPTPASAPTRAASPPLTPCERAKADCRAKGSIAFLKGLEAYSLADSEWEEVANLYVDVHNVSSHRYGCHFFWDYLRKFTPSGHRFRYFLIKHSISTGYDLTVLFDNQRYRYLLAHDELKALLFHFVEEGFCVGSCLKTCTFLQEEEFYRLAIRMLEKGLGSDVYEHFASFPNAVTERLREHAVLREIISLLDQSLQLYRHAWPYQLRKIMKMSFEEMLNEEDEDTISKSEKKKIRNRKPLPELLDSLYKVLRPTSELNRKSTVPGRIFEEISNCIFNTYDLLTPMQKHELKRFMLEHPYHETPKMLSWMLREDGDFRELADVTYQQDSLELSLRAKGIDPLLATHFHTTSVSCYPACFIQEFPKTLEQFLSDPEAQKGAFLINFTQQLHGHFSIVYAEKAPSGKVQLLVADSTGMHGGYRERFLYMIADSIAKTFDQRPHEIFAFKDRRQFDTGSCAVFAATDLLAVTRCTNVFAKLANRSLEETKTDQGTPFVYAEIPFPEMMRMTQSMRKVERFMQTHGDALLQPDPLLELSTEPMHLRTFIDTHTWYVVRLGIAKRQNLAAPLTVHRLFAGFLMCEQQLPKGGALPAASALAR